MRGSKPQMVIRVVYRNNFLNYHILAINQRIHYIFSVKLTKFV